MSMITNGCMIGDYEGCFQHVGIPGCFIRTVGRGAEQELWAELKAALKSSGGDPDSSHTKVEISLGAGGYTKEELEGCDEIAKILLKLKPRHVSDLLFSMSNTQGLEAAERIVVGAKIRNIFLQSSHYTTTLDVTSAQDGQYITRILAYKPVKTLTFRGLVFASQVLEGSLATAIMGSKTVLEFRQCVFLENSELLTNAISGSKMPIVKFVDMTRDEATHDFSLKMLHSAASSKLQSLTVSVPIWSEDMELAVAHCISQSTSLGELVLDVHHAMLQRMPTSGDKLLQAIKASFAGTTIKIFDEDDPFRRPYLYEFSSIFGPTMGSLIYCFSRLNRAGRKRSILDASRVTNHKGCFFTLGVVTNELDCLFVHLKEIPGLFGQHALKPPEITIAGGKGKAGSSGARKRKAVADAGIGNVAS